MNTEIQQIHQIKLNELHEQRERLLNQYEQLENSVAKASSLTDKVTALYKGLQDIRFADKRLHPEASNLEILLWQAKNNGAPEDTLSLWKKRLEQSLEHGRNRTHTVMLFGELLREWANPPETKPLQLPKRDELVQEFVELWTSKTDTSKAQALFEEVIAEYSDTFEIIKDNLNEFFTTTMERSISVHEVRDTAKWIRQNSCNPSFQKKAQELENEEESIVNEYAGALTILLQRVKTWQWPDTGVVVGLFWRKYKWRPFLEEDFVQHLLLQTLGNRLCGHLINDTQIKELLKEEISELDTSVQDFQTMMHHQFMFCATDPSGDGYNQVSKNLEESTIHQKLFYWLNLELELLRKLYPNSPQCVLQLDLKNFYPSISSEVIATMLEVLEIPSDWKDFFAQFLQIPRSIKGLSSEEGEEGLTSHRGMPFEHLLSHSLSELLMLFMRLYVQKQSQEKLFGMVDDLYLCTHSDENLSKAWEGIKSFCKVMGLTPHAEKSGAYISGKKIPSTLPQNPIRWGLLEMGEDESWLINEPLFKQYKSYLKQHLKQTPALLEKTALYNEYIRFLLGQAAPLAALGKSHIEMLSSHFAKLHQQLFNEKTGIEEYLKQDLEKRFFQDNTPPQLPSAWYYWPLTAGGLGLMNPLLYLGMVTSDRATYRELKLKGDFSQWDSYNTNLSTFAVFINDYKKLKTPERTSDMGSLLDDFIARSGEVSGRHIYDIATIWKWIIYTYGPQILDAFGSFRFLMTDFVPFHLVLRTHNAIDEMETIEGGDIPF